MNGCRNIFALGFFDGVHVGHQALLRQCRELARCHGLQTGAVTFDSHPGCVVTGSAPPLINTPQDRDRLLRRFGAETVVTLPFDRQLMTMPWQEFLELLCREYGAAGFVCGDDFRFGHKGQGNAALLTEFCEKRGFPVSVVAEQTLDGSRISSTAIRHLIEAGEMNRAVRFLGHPHVLTGTVVKGKQLGRTIGIPTANLLLPQGVVCPAFGVYACRVTVDGREYRAVTNVGTRPTVSGVGITVEPWILDFSGDLYGREIQLQFCEFLRPEQKFPDLQALQQAIRADADKCRQL